MMNIYQRVNQHRLSNPDKTACVLNNDRLSYKTLLNQVDSLTQGLVDIGVTGNSRIALFCPNDFPFVVVLLASAKIGAAVAPLPLSLKGESVAVAIQGAQCDFVIAWETIARSIIERRLLAKERVVNFARPENGERYFDDLFKPAPYDDIAAVSADRDFILTMTSGSTGQPKPIVLTQQTKIERAFGATIDYYELTSEERILVATPLYHSLAQRSLLVPLMLGATAVILPKFSVSAWINAVTEHGISFLFAVSDQLKALLLELNNGDDFGRLKCVVSSSATLDAQDKATLRRVLNCRFHECYGASEVGVVTDFDITQPGVPIASVGKPLPSVKVKICDRERWPLSTGSLGEIACLSPTRFKGYFHQEKQTQKCFDEDGYFYTGDIGYLDERGYLYFVSRRKDVIKTGGISVFLPDIEAVIRQVPGVQECAAIGVEDKTFGEVIQVAYVLADPASEFEQRLLVMHAAQHLADYQQPRVYHRLDSLPKSELGKVLKPRLKELLMQQKVENSV